MDFRFTAREEQFRQELMRFLDDELGPDWDGTSETLDCRPSERERQFLRKLAERGWLVPSWPKVYGGAGLSIMEQFIFNREMGYRRAPRPRGGGPGLVGPMIILHGTPEQKAQHLPPIARGETVWSIGFSEHNAGSDLAALQCRAVRNGDDYIITGTKMWTSYAHFADWMMLYVRTDPHAPKHRGISCLLVDMKTPGIRLRPYLSMTGVYQVNEVVFEDVRVPRGQLLGEENRGWYIAASTLDIERSGVGDIAAYRRDLDDLITCFRDERRRLPPGARAAARHRLADLHIACETGTLLTYRVASMQARGLIPNYETSMSKIFTTEFGRWLYNTGMSLLGLFGQLRPGSPWVKLKGRMERSHLQNVVHNIAAGSNEIQRNIIAQRGLDLPRE